MKFLLPVILFTLVVSSQGMAQVGDVNKGSRSNKERTRKDSDGDFGRGGGGGVFLFLEIFDVISLIGKGQKEQLSRRFDERYRVSLEAGLHGGYYNDEGTFIFLPSFRGNWGLLSTHLRSNRMQDRTGQFQTLDWQVIQFNLVNIPEFTLRTGTGFSHVQDIDDTYHESTVELIGHINNRKINPGLGFRWSNDYQTNEVPRLEVNLNSDFQILQSGKFRVNAMGGYLFQRYLGPEAGDYVRFHFLQAGLNLYFY